MWYEVIVLSPVFATYAARGVGGATVMLTTAWVEPVVFVAVTVKSVPSSGTMAVPVIAPVPTSKVSPSGRAGAIAKPSTVPVNAGRLGAIAKPCVWSAGLAE